MKLSLVVESANAREVNRLLEMADERMDCSKQEKAVDLTGDW